MRRRCLKALLSHLVSEWRECHWLERLISTVDFWQFVNSLNKDFPSDLCFVDSPSRHQTLPILGCGRQMCSKLQPLEVANVAHHLLARQVQQMQAVCVCVASEHSLSW